jgi:hypothetical protein
VYDIDKQTERDMYVCEGERESRDSNKPLNHHISHDKHRFCSKSIGYLGTHTIPTRADEGGEGAHRVGHAVRTQHSLHTRNTR